MNCRTRTRTRSPWSLEVKPSTPKIPGIVAVLLCGVFICGPAAGRLSAGRDTAKHQQGTEGANSQSFEKLASSAQSAMDADRIPVAIRLYDRATKVRPDWAEGWWHLGTLSFDAGRFLQSRDAFAHFVAAEQKQPVPPLRIPDTDRTQAHAEAQVFGVSKTGLDCPPS